jgi:integrase
MDRVLEADVEDIRKWTERLGSSSTRDVWPRRLAAFCVTVGKTPGDLIRLASEVNDRGQRTALRDLLAEFEKKERSRGKKGSTVAFGVKIVKSWLAFNGVEVPRGLVKVRDSDDVYSEAALTREELRLVLHSASRRERAAVALMALAGFRPMVLGNYDGSDGLRLRDLVDLEVDSSKRTASFRRMPARIVVRQELSKAKHVYSSFLTTEGCEYLVEYLNARMRPNAEWKKGEKFRPDSPVIIPERAGRDFIVTTNIGDLVRNAIRKAGLKARPYSLRTTFATRLLSAEAEGKVPHSLSQFFMGHRGDMTARYAQNRGQLPPEVIEQMREAFKRCEPYLSTSDVLNADKERQAFVRMVLVANGIPEKDIDALGDLTPEKAIEVLREAGVGKKADVVPVPPTRVGEQRLVSGNEVEAWLSVGWSGKFAVGDRVMLEAPPSKNGSA